MQEKSGWIEKIAEHEEDWLGIAASFVGNEKARDIIQEMYISVSKWADERIIKEDGEPNRSYIYLVIRTECAKEFKRSKKEAIIDEPIDDQIEYQGVPEKVLAFERLMIKIDNFTNNWSWYDRTLFNLYKDTPFSLRGLAKETNISWMSIHNTITICKKKIHDEFYEDYEDFVNEDYHLI